MKSIYRIIPGIFMSCSCVILSSQDISNKSLGLQVNPYFDEHLFTHSAIQPVYALRYGLGIKNHFTFGPEISGNTFKSISTGNKANTLRTGVFARYSFLPDKRIKPFLELSPYFAFYSWNYGTTGYLTHTEPKGSGNYFSGYMGPGVSFYSKSEKFSIDLFYKFSDRKFVNGKQAVLSYRLNYNF